MDSLIYKALVEKVNDTFSLLAQERQTTAIPDYLVDRLVELLRKAKPDDPNAILGVLRGLFQVLGDGHTVPDNDPILSQMLKLASFCEELAVR